MIKTYLLMGSLALSGIAMVGGSAYYNSPDDSRADLKFVENVAPQTAGSVDNAEPVPMPLWLLQKIFSSEAALGTPVPCPVWMLYNMSTMIASPKPKA